MNRVYLREGRMSIQLDEDKMSIQLEPVDEHQRAVQTLVVTEEEWTALLDLRKRAQIGLDALVAVITPNQSE